MNLKKIILVTGFLLASYVSQAQIYNYYQIFIYNFAKYIQWPAEKQSGDFVIGVLGNSPITDKLKEMSLSKKVGIQSIKVVSFQNVDQISNCHILFIPVDQSNYFDAVKSKVQNTSTLLITEEKNLGKKGSNINFIVVDGKLRFELNKMETEKANLKVSSDLTKLAILI